VDVGGRLVVKADADARTAQFVTLARDGSRWRATSRLDTLNGRWPLDTATERVVRAWQDSLARRLGPERVVGTAPAPIEGRDRVSRYGESALGDLVADALRHGTGADVAVINSGAMRIDDVLAAGPISNYQLESIFLFADETRVITFPITGAALRQLLEHSVSDGIYGHGGFLQVSGISFEYDPSRPSGSRLVCDIRRANGTVLAPTDTVRLAFNTYPACRGGDGYKVPAASAACADSTDAPRAVDLLVSYITGPLKGAITIPVTERITRRE
jgi:2',3'-cyclic-nucleotide 2'-phosphodiesterase (5'-nucleotidase family)